MDTIVKEKGCLIEGHSSKDIHLMCIDRSCQQESRLLCSDCILEKQNLHPECSQYITFQDFESKKLQFQYSSKSSCKIIYDILSQTEEQLVKNIDTYFDKLIHNISNKLNELRKNHKVESLEKLKHAKETYSEFLEKQSLFKNIDEIQENFLKLQENLTDIHEFNRLLTEKQQQTYTKIEQESNYSSFQIYMQKQEFKIIDPQKLNKLSQDIEKKIEDTDIFKTFPLKNLSTLSSIKGLYNNYQVDSQNCYSHPSNTVFFNLKSDIFKKEENQYFKFKLNKIDTQSFGIGVSSYEEVQRNNTFGFDSGYQVQIQKDKFNQNKENSFIQNGKKQIQEVFKEGQIFIVEICIQANILNLYDQDQECLVQLNQKFSQNIEEWVLVIGTNSQSPYQQWNFQVL